MNDPRDGAGDGRALLTALMREIPAIDVIAGELVPRFRHSSFDGVPVRDDTLGREPRE